MEKDIIYLDNSATTCPSTASLDKMREALSVSYANPGSVHRMGNEANRLMTEARSAVGLTLGIRRPKDGHVIFTSGGSEANNLALFGSILAKERSGGRVIIGDGEHPSINECAHRLESMGFEVITIPTSGGALDLEYLRKCADARTVLASFMLVNNETGALYDVAAAAAIVREKAPRAFIHSDCVQGYLKTPFSLKSLGVDAVSVSAHKIHAPKGAGALCITEEVIKGKRLVPTILGGGQESGFRSGTENVAAICAFGAAAKEGFSQMKDRCEKIRSLRLLLENEVGSIVRINSPVRSIPNIINMTLPSIKSETMLNYLSGEGICISAGSACSARSKRVSRALTAFGIPEEEADCSVRVSLSHLNTEDEIHRFADALREGIQRLAKIK